MPIPAPYDDPPFYHDYMTIFMLAFKELNDDRPLGGDIIYKITLKQIIEWSELRGFDDPDFIDDLIAHIKGLDRVWINLEIERRNKAAKKRQGKSNGEKVSPSQLRPKAQSVRERHTQAAKRN